MNYELTTSKAQCSHLSNEPLVVGGDMTRLCEERYFAQWQTQRLIPHKQMFALVQKQLFPQGTGWEHEWKGTSMPCKN